MLYILKDMSGENRVRPFLFEDKWGYKDNKGNNVVSPCWDYADVFHEGFAIVRNDKGLYGFLNSDGQMALECQYEEAMKFIDGVALVKTKVGNWEHINCKGELLHNCPWIDVYPYSEGLAAVRKPINDVDKICGITARYGFINEERELVIPCDYSQVSSFRDGYARVTDVFGNCGFINKEGKIMHFLDIVEPYNNPENVIPLPKEWAKNNDLSIINPFNFDLSGNPQEIRSLYFKEGLAIVLGNNGKMGFINSKGKLVIPCKWSSAYNFHDGLAFVSDEKQNEFMPPKGGLINLQGQIIIPTKWIYRFKFDQWFNSSITSQEIAFTEGLIAVKGKNNRWGFIDKRGKLQIPLRWMEVRSFREGYAAVKGLNGRYGFIDYRGNLICKLRWASVADFHEGMACVYDDNLQKYGFLNSRGELQIPCTFDSGDDFHEGIAYVELYGKVIPIDEGGDRIEAEHDKPIDGESISYEKYSGSYAQDEMGYSDDDIDTIFDGDPNAYWNID